MTKTGTDNNEYTVYILRTSGNTLYTGQTNDLQRRLKEHENGKYGAKYLRRFDKFELAYKEVYESRSEAMKREVEIKRMSKSKKERMIK